MKKFLIIENGSSIENIIYNSKDMNCKFLLPFQPLTEIPDLVIADLTSIKKEKVELLIQLKNNPVISLVPFLMIISEGGGGLDENFSIQNYYLKKPFTNENLVRQIKKIINHIDNLSPW